LAWWDPSRIKDELLAADAPDHETILPFMAKNEEWRLLNVALAW
jgi:hypothetical protein